MNELLDFFSANGIEWEDKSNRCIDVCCPFCPEQDTGFHCGVFKDHLNFSCFKCGARGPINRLTEALTGSRFRKGRTKQIPEEGLVSEVKRRLQPAEEAQEIQRKISLPPNCKRLADLGPILKRVANRYLQSRGFSLEIAMKYGTHYCTSGEAVDRLILPVFHKGCVVSWLGRAIWDQTKPKILTAPNSNVSRYLYELDQHLDENRIIIVEGAFDLWAVNVYLPRVACEQGSMVVATLGKSLSDNQLSLLLDLKRRKSVNRITLAWDGDATIQAMDTVSRLKPYFDTTIKMLPKEHDPASLGKWFFEMPEVEV